MTEYQFTESTQLIESDLLDLHTSRKLDVKAYGAVEKSEPSKNAEIAAILLIDKVCWPTKVTFWLLFLAIAYRIDRLSCLLI